MATLQIEVEDRKFSWEIDKTTAILLAQTMVHQFGAGKEA
jgi:hypothetical protein